MRRLRWLAFLLVPSFAWAAERVTCASPPATPGVGAEYFVSVGDREQHVLHVAIRYHQSGVTTFQMPVWNALYQVRDFAQYVTHVRATSGRGATLAVTVPDKTSWQIAAADGCAVLEYDVFANSPGPFGAQASNDHVFVNWAQVLVYVPSLRSSALMLTVRDVPEKWSLHDLGRFDETTKNGEYRLAQPILYDRLVDSPVEIGTAQMVTFNEDGATYRIVVDADTADYKGDAIEDAIKKVVHAEVDWMQDRPFDEYTFIYHFPHAPIGGGMEHAFGTAITEPANRLKDDQLAPISTTAHEFFHLWNVKRIRPQSMEPVDFEHEQYSDSLWFCEGVTSTVSELMLVRAGLGDERSYLTHVGGVISDFEARPAHREQSPEASSVGAWMEGRPYYRRPVRSVSYYTSGELLGILLDLRIRELTHGKKSLRDLFHLLNDQYAKRERFYDDSRAIEQAAESVSGASFRDFFAKYVSGIEAIPYDEFFRVVGLKLQPFSIASSDAGFDAGVNFSGLPEVTRVAPGSAVEAASVRVGDTLASMDDRELQGDLSFYLTAHKPGDTVAFKFMQRGRAIVVKVVLAEASVPAFGLVDLPTVTPEQRAMRAAWIVGDDLAPGAAK